ncbi:MAG: hypothetical protein ACKVQQ_04555 [Burkholderiales bacterium]
MPDRTDALSRRKEELRLLARIERAELAMHLREVRRLKQPAHFASVGARILSAWRNPGWLGAAATLLAARGATGSKFLMVLRYAFFGFAAWRTWRLLREYASQRPR